MIGLSLALAGVSGCGGYVWVKKSDLDKPPKVIVDSAQVLALRQQLADLEASRRADSVKYATALAAATRPIGVPDSVLKARDADIAALKDQLTKVQAELDRIKRRLATPRS
jgi:hypothetical protein